MNSSSSRAQHCSRNDIAQRSTFGRWSVVLTCVVLMLALGGAFALGRRSETTSSGSSPPTSRALEERLTHLEQKLRGVAAENSRLTLRAMSNTARLSERDEPSTSGVDQPEQGTEVAPAKAEIPHEKVVEIEREFAEDRFADLNATIDSEPSDSQWTSQLTTALAVGREGAPNLVVPEVNCGSSLCKISYQLDEQSASDFSGGTMGPQLMLKVGHLVGGSALRLEDDGRLSLFVSQKGNRMPAPRASLSTYMGSNNEETE